MKRHLPLLLLLLFTVNLFSQTLAKNSKKTLYLPIVTSMNFQAIATPFHNAENNFRNPGFSIGTELNYTKKNLTFQSINFGYFFNKYNGNAAYLNSQFIYRPKIYKALHLEIKFGPGLIDLFLPTQPYTLINGNWEKSSDHGNLAITVNTGIGLWLKPNIASNNIISPFVQYDIMGITRYNKSIPVLPTTLINFGCRIDLHQNKKST